MSARHVWTQIIECVANERKVKAVTQRQAEGSEPLIWNWRASKDTGSTFIPSNLVPQTWTALQSYTTSDLQETSATKCFKGCGKQVLISYLCENVLLNVEFTFHIQQL